MHEFECPGRQCIPKTCAEFECPGRQCIPKTSRCNFFSDCLLGDDDELNCGTPQNTGMLISPLSLNLSFDSKSTKMFSYIPLMLYMLIQFN